VSPYKPGGPFIVTIDGPAGSGKSTVARQAAERLGLTYVDTGAMYRALTLKAIRNRIDFENGRELGDLAGQTDIEQEIMPGGKGAATFLEGEDVSSLIRSPEVTAAVSAVSKHKKVRRAMVAAQQEIATASARGAVVEGRDIGTVVFPEAPVKIYLDASVEERARRRKLDLDEAGEHIEEDQVASLLNKRDALDSERDHSPLAAARDSIRLDTTVMSPDEVVDAIQRLAESAGFENEEERA